MVHASPAGARLRWAFGALVAAALTVLVWRARGPSALVVAGSLQLPALGPDVRNELGTSAQPLPRFSTLGKEAKSEVSALTAAGVRWRCFRPPPPEAFLQQASFLPPPAQLLATADADAAADTAAEAFARHAANCSCRLKRPFPLCPYGVGSSLSSALKPMSENFRRGLPSHLGGPAGTNVSFEDLGLMSTVSVGACATAAAASSNASSGLVAEPGRRRRQAAPRPKKLPACPVYECRAIMQLPTVVPQEFRHLGLFWWTAQQLRWLLRPAPQGQLDRLLAAERARLQWESQRPILALHVRHGDSCTPYQQFKTRRRCEGLDVYVRAIESIRGYGYRSIYLATDDPSVVEEAKKRLAGNFTLLLGPPSQAQDRSRGEQQSVVFDDITGRIDLGREYREVLLDILLLADADGFVGKFTSNIFRLAYALNFGLRRCAAPYVSLDSFWCNAFGEPGGRTLDGRTFYC
eukprot:TRINITY_DN5470_c0_g5_i1.p1 TRINITY_DN5470_c0_g5~~TRINITY_DN5470_c0_g5_i1.p1  ORF type:complete len:464 (+),score=89.37 TRINITY_DN5470_c0_g5_i1:279-1670(+)